MAWTIPQPRSPEELKAYRQGFTSAVHLAVKYESEGKPMAELAKLNDLVEQTLGEDGNGAG